MSDEGVTMDRDGNLYVVNENGGGDTNHPQLWVYAPSTVPNQAPTGVALQQPGHVDPREHEHRRRGSRWRTSS